MSIQKTTLGRLAAALTLAFGLASTQAQPTTTTTTAPAASPTASGAGSGTAGAKGKTTLSASDRRFAEDAATDGMAEVMMGKLAQERAASAEVRSYGERMVADHTKSNEKLMAMASSRGLNLPDKPTAAQQRMHEKLSKEQGAKFDQAYMSHMLDDHRKAVSLFQKQARSGDDAELKAFAQQTLPTLQDHLKTATTVNDSLKQKR